MGVDIPIKIIPEYPSNSALEESIRKHLNQRNRGHKAYGKIDLIVFRPSGRPGDEFDQVLPIIQNCDGDVFLLVAFSGGYRNISNLIPESERNKVKGVEPIFIHFGELVSKNSDNYANNQASFKSIATQMHEVTEKKGQTSKKPKGMSDQKQPSTSADDSSNDDAMKKEASDTHETVEMSEVKPDQKQPSTSADDSSNDDAMKKEASDTHETVEMSEEKVTEKKGQTSKKPKGMSDQKQPSISADDSSNDDAMKKEASDTHQTIKMSEVKVTEKKGQTSKKPKGMSDQKQPSTSADDSSNDDPMKKETDED